MPAAAAGFFPLDQQLALGDKAWSEEVERTAVWLSGAVSSYALVAEVLQRVGQINLAQASIWRSTQAAGTRFCALEEAERQQANALPEVWTPPSRGEVADQRMGVAMDGATMHNRSEGWKDVKLGVVFDVAVLAATDQVTGESVPTPHAVHNRYVAHLGGPEVLGEKIWTLARSSGWEQAQDTIVIGDGAPWIWNQAALHFGQSQQVVDWYHAKAHLVAAARLLYPEDTPAFRRWLNRRETLLYQGQAETIASQLEAKARKDPTKAAALTTAAGYFRTNYRRMNYLERREELWPIGSGMVESAAKQFKARFAGPGMRWSRQGAEHLLPIRAAVLSHRFDTMWLKAKNLPQL